MIGIMQGRLSPMVSGKIQAFPERFWKAEFFTAEAVGFELIEWTLDRKNILDNPLLSNQDAIETIKNLSGVDVRSVTYDAAMQAPLVSNGNIEFHEVDTLLHVLDSCKNLGVGVLIFPLVDNSSVEDRDYQKYLEIFRSIDGKILSSNLRLAIESDFEPRRLRRFIEDIGSPNIGINYDTGNSASLGFSFHEEMAEYSSLIFNIHLKDRKLNGATVPLGEGDAPLRDQVLYFNKYLADRNLIIQGARSGCGDDVGSAKNYLQFVDSLGVQ